jgi:hypothetical protein
MAMMEMKDIDGVKVVNGVATKISNDDVSTNPSNAELVAAFGAASENEGKLFIVDDAGADTNAYIVVCNGSSYFYHQMSKAS